MKVKLKNIYNFLAYSKIIIIIIIIKRTRTKREEKKIEGVDAKFKEEKKKKKKKEEIVVNTKAEAFMVALLCRGPLDLSNAALESVVRWLDSPTCAS
jgi:hypothetical protein